MGAKYTDAQKRATKKYKKENYKRITFDAPKKFVENIRAAAAASNQSISGYISESIRARMDRDGFDPSDCPGDAAPPPEEVQEKK